jgi:hypothetical protein
LDGANALGSGCTTGVAVDEELEDGQRIVLERDASSIA